jgi:hypothetical protein
MTSIKQKISKSKKLKEIQLFVKVLMNSTYEKFLEKVYDKTPKFVFNSTNNKNYSTNQNNMKKLTKAEMKDILYTSAIHLLKVNGTTTNLDIKEHARQANPGVWIDQTIVHECMEELSQEKTDWNRSLTSGGYNEYTPIQTFANTTTTTAPVALLPQGATTQATVNTSSTEPAKIVGKVNDNTKAFLEALSGDLRVVYASGFDAMLTNTTDKYEARKLYNKQTPGVDWDNIRMPQLKAYLEKNF